MRRLITGLALLLLVLIAVACAKASAPMPAPTPTPSPVPAPAPAPAPPPKIALFSSGEGSQGEATIIMPPTPTEERMIIRTGEMSLVVQDIIGARDKIAQLAAEFGGYVVSSRIRGEEQEMRGNISIRVPDDKFETALEELRALAERVVSESTSSQDVTEEYIDLKARLKNSEATESQYLALLGKADKVEDILKIYESLSRVRQEIEQLKGRMQYLERTSSMSLINVSLQPATTAKPLVRAGWSAIEVLKSALRGITTFGQWLGTVAIWLVIFSPVWGAIAGIVYWRRRKKRAQPKS